jgi:long-chain acyl-CoA synthetase
MRTLLPIIRRILRSPWRVAVVDDQRQWKAIHLYAGALHLARTIEQTTDSPHVGIMLPTSGMFPMAMMATWMLGRTIVPLNYLLARDELDYVINDAEIDTVITVEKMVEFTGGLPDRVRQIRLEDMSFRGFPPLRRAARRPDDHLAVLLYTSGTSGKPKGVMLTAGNLAVNVQQCIEWAEFSRIDVMLGVLPQFHSFGLTVLTLLPLTIGCKIVYTARFAPKKILDLLIEHRPSALIAIPTMLNALLHAKSATADHFTSLRFLVSGGEPLPASVFEGYEQKFGITINEGYGLTETAPATNWCRPRNQRRGSVGMPMPLIDEKIVDAEGNRLPTNQDGEVCIRGPNVMKGYYKLPEQTRAVFDSEGYFRTGDMGRFDDDGYLYITGRIKEMLIIGGENVFPREIEEVLNKHPSVKDSAVIGVMDESRGELPWAFIELNDGATFDETSLRSHCRHFLAQYKVPREIRVVDALPRNPTGKIMRRQLKAMVDRGGLSQATNSVEA